MEVNGHRNGNMECGVINFGWPRIINLFSKLLIMYVLDTVNAKGIQIFTMQKWLSSQEVYILVKEPVYRHLHTHTDMHTHMHREDKLK